MMKFSFSTEAVSKVDTLFLKHKYRKVDLSIKFGLLVYSFIVALSHTDLPIHYVQFDSENPNVLGISLSLVLLVFLFSLISSMYYLFGYQYLFKNIVSKYFVQKVIDIEIRRGDYSDVIASIDKGHLNVDSLSGTIKIEISKISTIVEFDEIIWVMSNHRKRILLPKVFLLTLLNSNTYSKIEHGGFSVHVKSQ